MSFRTFDLGFKTWVRDYLVGRKPVARPTRFWRKSGLSLERAAVGSWIAVAKWITGLPVLNTTDVPQRSIGGDSMDGDYVFLCGVMWCRFGQQDAGKELLRATNSVDPDMKALAWAMLAKGARRLRDMERPTLTGSRAILEGNLCG